MMGPKTAGQVAFEAYNEAKGGRTYDDKPIPPWSDVGEAVRSAWEAAAAAVQRASHDEARIEAERERAEKAERERDELDLALRALMADVAERLAREDAERAP